MAEIFNNTVLVFGVFMGLAHYPQALRILRTKSAESVSMITYLIFAPGCWLWLTYGIVIGQWPVIVSFSIGSIGATAVLLLIFKYRVGN